MQISKEIMAKWDTTILLLKKNHTIEKPDVFIGLEREEKDGENE